MNADIEAYLDELKTKGECFITPLEADNWAARWDKTREFAHQLASGLGIEIVTFASWTQERGNHLVVLSEERARLKWRY